MKKNKPIHRSPLALVILAFLAEEPMHPYRMQQLIKERGKDEVINVRQRASIYQSIERLQREGLITVRETTKESGRPDRTIYEATPEGHQLMQDWMREILSTPKLEFPEFPVAVACLPLLTQEDALQQLKKRAAAYEEELARMKSQLEGVVEVVPRLFLLEMELKQAILTTELTWVQSVIDDLISGALSWDKEWLSKIGTLIAESMQMNSKNEED
ncbi:PadR family transcriptional regulator [Paenibacillus eucommiae]|uniref:DNA-binding PadR family transcriptional regulator n=1 Tax=Paenibacillus eucommiae TaxID=1355755 RepID=A0ABS4J929_9BACL|nr:PadR family transcriptional regulator [Paenibacillus eucommiae]MBP1996348.1 DNA-binding PadR family transcriptional regulator [Paenibacillus eucommiae]